MLKKVFAIGLTAAVALAFSGCTDPIVPYQDPISQYPQIHVEAYSLQGKIKVEPPSTPRVGAGQLKVQIPIRNLSDSDLTLDYIYSFYNHGVISEGPSSRMFVRVPRKGIGQIEFTSLTAVEDFRVEIFYAK